jgi:hypothetical protein
LRLFFAALRLCVSISPKNNVHAKTPRRKDAQRNRSAVTTE